MTSNMRPTLWQRTLESFIGQQIQLRLRDGSIRRGWLEEIGPASVKVQPAGAMVDYVDLLECTTAGDAITQEETVQ